MDRPSTRPLLESRLFAWVYNVDPPRADSAASSRAASPSRRATCTPSRRLPADEARRHGQPARGHRRHMGPQVAPGELMTLGCRWRSRRRAARERGWTSSHARAGPGQGHDAQMIATTASIVGQAPAPSSPTGNGPTHACPRRSSRRPAAYRFTLSVRNEGDRLVYTNRGTDPSVGSSTSPPACCGRASRTRC